MALETGTQRLIHIFEQGGGATLLRRLLITSAIIGIAFLWMFLKFNGFSTPAAMDQAQIGRQLATGQGYTTLLARPLALHLIQNHRGKIPSPLPEINQSPLGPLINSAVLKISGANTIVDEKELVSPAERAIATAGLLFLIASLVACYRIGCRLFTQQEALLGTGLLIVTGLLWRFSSSGLPQIPMLFFFSTSMLSLIAALEAQERTRKHKALFLTLVSSLLLGIMTLGNGIGLWFFPGFWIFAVAAMRPRRTIALAVPAVYILPLLPWALHNWMAIGNPFGMAFYELFRPYKMDRFAFQADFDPFLYFHWADFLKNTGTQALSQLSLLISHFNGNIVAAAFFPAVFLLPFQRWQAAQFRWVFLMMWAGAFIGMSIFGVNDEVSVNQLHILFLPIMVFYGLWFLLVLWDRLEMEMPLLRNTFIIALYAIVATPLGLTLFSRTPHVNWPPYLPPLISQFHQWVTPSEAMASDIPWATAWYAERKSLLLPANINQFELIHTERLLDAPLVGIYLTPFSGGQRTYADIINGPYKNWARFVLHEVREADIREWILSTMVNLPVDGGSVFYSDRVRWQQGQSSPGP